MFDLDEEEQELSDSIDRGEWKSVDNLEEEIQISREAAARYLRKHAHINITTGNSQ